MKKNARMILTAGIFSLTAKGDPVTLLNIDTYRYNEPLFEGARVVLNAMGETFSPEYIQGISGAAFKIATGCPSRPTCVHDAWTSDFITSLGYKIEEYPCFDNDGKDVTDAMVGAVKRHIDSGKPALVWHAFTSAEWDVVCGYDNDAKQFLGRGTHKGHGELAREPWDRAKTAVDICPAFGAILIGEKTPAFDARAAEKRALENAVKHARSVRAEDQAEWDYAGVEGYKKWAAKYAAPGADRDLADAYCHGVYASTRRAAAGFLREIAPKYDGQTATHLRDAANCFEREAKCLEDAGPCLSWESPAGVDEERSKKVAPILAQAADAYEKAIEHLEKINMEKLDMSEAPKFRDTFETENCILRRWRESDAEDLRQYAVYKNGSGFETWEKWPEDIGECKKCAAFFAQNKTGWAIERKADSRVVGFVAYNEVKDRLLDFGHAFTHPLESSVELKTEALRVMVQHAFDTLDIDAVDARNEKAWTDNTAPLFALGFAELEDKMQMTRARWKP